MLVGRRTDHVSELPVDANNTSARDDQRLAKRHEILYRNDTSEVLFSSRAKIDHDHTADPSSLHYASVLLKKLTTRVPPYMRHHLKPLCTPGPTNDYDYAVAWINGNE